MREMKEERRSKAYLCAESGVRGEGGRREADEDLWTANDRWDWLGVAEQSERNNNPFDQVKVVERKWAIGTCLNISYINARKREDSKSREADSNTHRQNYILIRIQVMVQDKRINLLCYPPN